MLYGESKAREETISLPSATTEPFRLNCSPVCWVHLRSSRSPGLSPLAERPASSRPCRSQSCPVFGLACSESGTTSKVLFCTGNALPLVSYAVASVV